MAQDYTHNSYGHPVGYWYYLISESDINTTNNTSKITVNFYVKAAHKNLKSDTYNNYPAGYGSSTPYARIYINGQLMTTKTPANFDLRYNSSKKVANNTYYHLGTASKVITHNSNGEGSVTVKCQHYTSVSPNWVTLESTHKLQKINKPAPAPAPTPTPSPAPTISMSDLVVTSGTYNIGSTLNYKIKAISGGLTHDVYIKTNKHSTYKQILSKRSFSANTTNSLSFTIPNDYKNGVAQQGTDTMEIYMKAYNGSSLVGERRANVSIRNNDYTLSFDTLYSTSELKKGNYLKFRWAANTSFGIKLLKYTVSGAYSDSGSKETTLGTGGEITAGAIKASGTIYLTVTLTDFGGHTVSRSITLTIPEEHRLSITNFAQTNSNVYVLKNHTIGNSKFKFVVNWDNTHTITSVKFNVTGANPMTHSKSYPSGKSYTWTTNNVTKAGDNKAVVTITDSKGQTRTSTINVKTLEEASTMNIDSSIVDPNLCVDLVKGLAYMDYSRLGVRIKINHTHALKTVKVTINGRENTLKNIDQYASEFTFIDSKKIEKAGDVSVKFYAQDVNGKEDSHSITYKTYKIIDPPKKPIISYEDPNNMIYLSEGEKIIFEGESSNIEDYQVIYVLSSCDVINALSFCNNSANSYLDANKSTLMTNLNNNTTGALRYHMLKDFGVGSGSSIVTKDSSKSNRFHIHPLTPAHEKFYALQFLNEAKPGDKIFVHVRERKLGTFDTYLYSDNYEYNKVPKNNLFSMCVLPPSPCQLNIYKKEQTSDKLIIRYSNPLYDASVNSETINLIDVCLIAKDQAGNLLDTNGSKSKSENRKRDGMNGKTWIYYTERKWHNVVPKAKTSNNRKEFEMSFDISKYPKGTCFNMVAFYYPDYYNHPSIYSTSNIININKSNIGMFLQINEPVSGITSTTANPTFKIRVNSLTTEQGNVSSIYENYNAAKSWNKSKWDSNPIWFRVPRAKDSQVPNFTRGICYTDNQPSKEKLSEPKHKIEIYNTNQDIYRTANLFRISGASINDEGSFKENALFIRANDNNQVYIGDIETSVLLDQGYIDFTWQQQSGRFLSIGENNIEAFTTPYLYDNEMIDYLEHQSYWVSDTTLYSMPIMSYNPFRNSILKPATKSWADVEGDILTIKIPYALLKPNKEYVFKFSRFTDDGFFFEETGTITNSDLENLCEACMFTNVDAMDVTGLKYNQKNIIYSPAYCLITDAANTVQEVNNYNKWIQNQISFTTPSESKLIELDKENKNVIIDIKVRGINILKIKDITLVSSDGSHKVDTNKGTLDVSVRENRKSITVLFQGTMDIKFGYINPLSYKDMMDLRDYLKGLSSVYGVSPSTKLRTLVKDQSYLMANDFNDMKKYCIDLFTLIQKKYPYTFNSNIDAFNKLPTIIAGDKRGPSTYSKRGKHYFPEWDDLIDAIAGAFFKKSNLISSTECATWSSHTDTWIRHNQAPFLKASDKFTSAPSVQTTIAFKNAVQVNTTRNSIGAVDSVNIGNDQTLQLYYNGSNKMQSVFYFFDQVQWDELVNQSRTIQIVFTAHSDQSSFTINDFVLLGHTYANESQLELNLNNIQIATSPVIGGCTSYNYNSSKQIIFVCNTNELKQFKGVRLVSKKANAYIYIALSCIIKYS